MTQKFLFSPGRIVATPGAIEAFNEAEEDPQAFLIRHLTGDWSEMDKEDQQANRNAITNETRVFSSYQLSTGVKIWVITEWDRSVTTFLLPEEY